MSKEMNEIRSLFKRYRRQWILVAVLFSAVSFAGIIGVGFLIYGLGSSAARALDASRVGSQLDTSPKSHFASVESLAMGLASGWLTQNLLNSEITVARDSLQCFDALGGPKPLAVVERAKIQLADERLLSKLQEMSTHLKGSLAAGSGMEACGRLVFRSS